MRRLLIGIAVFAALVASVGASAAGLLVDAGTLQSGEDTTLKCDLDGVNLTWDVFWGTDTVSGQQMNLIRGFQISGVQQPQCHFKQVKIRVQWTNPPYTDTILSTQVNGATTLNFVLTAPRPVTALLDWHMALHDGEP
jgi:hypothetical protein